jgi:hypothetical protein
MAQSPQTSQRQTPPPPHYGLGQVVAAVIVFYIVAALFSGKGLHRWANKLPVNDATRLVRQWTEVYWAKTSRYGFEEPGHTIERYALDLQEAHPLLYPRKYRDVVERRKRPKVKRPESERVMALSARPVGTPTGPKPQALVIGDSLMMSVGPEIKRAIVSRLSGSAEVTARLATGLARPDVFDWQKELERLTLERQYDVIVMTLGTNDSQDFAVGGRILPYGTPEWVKVYNQRLAGLMHTACSAGAKVYWIGLPPMQSAAFQRKALRINGWARRQARAAGCVDYVATEGVLGDEDGRYVSYLRVGETLAKVRMVDGIHVTTAGGALIAESLVELIKKQSR